MEKLNRLFEKRYGRLPEQVTQITGSASPRLYYRLSAGEYVCMGVIGTDRPENEAFISISRHFRAKGIPVPEVYDASDDGMAYIQEDLGDEILLDSYVKAVGTEGSENMENLLCRTMSMLPVLQFEGAAGFVFDVCHPHKEFG